MAICNFCQRKFQSSQAVRAHLKYCTRYHSLRNERSGALGSPPRHAQPRTTARKADVAPIAVDSQGAQQDPFGLVLEQIKAMGEQPTPAPSDSPAQRRRARLQAAKAQVLDQYRTAAGIVTPALRGRAKMAIERALVVLPLEEFPLQEVVELATGIRDQIYEPAFREQAREAERERAEEKARDNRKLEDLGALLRESRRKRVLIQQTTSRARAFCDARRVPALERLSVEVDIESRLDALLTGSESIEEAQAAVQCVLDCRLGEVDLKLAAAQAKQAQEWWEEVTGLLLLGGVAGLVAVALQYPAKASQILEWIERVFGLTPTSAADPARREEPETAQPTAEVARRPRSMRRQKHPAPVTTPEPQQQAPVLPSSGRAWEVSTDQTATGGMNPVGGARLAT